MEMNHNYIHTENKLVGHLSWHGHGWHNKKVTTAKDELMSIMSTLES